MPAADEDGDPGPSQHFGDIVPISHFELGGPIQEHALPDHGRLVIQRVGMTLEGSTVAIVTGLGVAGTVGCVFLAAQPNGLIPGIVGIAGILVQISLYFRSEERRHRALRPEPRDAGQPRH